MPKADEIWKSPIFGDVIHEAWRVIDKWWTNEPIQKEFRDVTRNGERFVEFREENDPWQRWIKT